MGSCSLSEKEHLCASFDRRSCGLDEWSNHIPESDLPIDQEMKMKAFLESKGMGIQSVTLIQGFRSSTCYACGCPTTDRFEVVLENEFIDLNSLNLLNLSQQPCP